MAAWVDWSDPRIVSTVVTGCADPDHPVDATDDTVQLAIEVASEMLTRLTGFLIHPSGIAADDFRSSPLTRRLSPNYRPIREIISVVRLDADCVETPVDMPGWCIIGQSVYFAENGCRLGTWYQSVCGCGPGAETLRMTYEFGSTVTRSAEQAVLRLARQLWLECHPDQGDCELPERVTSVNREGLSYTIFDPMTFLDKGQTGLPKVDLWLATVNPSRALRPAGVFTPDAPPPVNRSVAVI